MNTSPGQPIIAFYQEHGGPYRILHGEEQEKSYENDSLYWNAMTEYIDDGWFFQVIGYTSVPRWYALDDDLMAFSGESNTRVFHRVVPDEDVEFYRSTLAPGDPGKTVRAFFYRSNSLECAAMLAEMNA